MARIFIGSSSQRIPIVEVIAEILRSHGHDVRAWMEIFEHGDITIDRLFSQARDVDGAILVFSADDKVEQQGVSKYQPRGNVLIEFGLFLGCLGRRKAIICNHGDNNKPSDLAGLTYLNIGDTPDSVTDDARRRLSAWAADLSRDAESDGVIQVFSSFPLPQFRQALMHARRLHILQTFIPYTQHLHLFETELLEAIRRDCEVQVLLLSPWSRVIEVRQQALSPAYGRNIVQEQIHINLEHFAALAKALPASQRHRLDVRVHMAMPSMSIYRVDDLFFAGHYYQGALAIDGPQLRVANLHSTLGRRLAKEHAAIWESPTTAAVDLLDIESWLGRRARR